jgi:hypothetical protein
MAKVKPMRWRSAARGSRAFVR